MGAILWGLFLCPKEVRRCQGNQSGHAPTPAVPTSRTVSIARKHEAAARKRYNKYGRPADSNKKYGRAWKRIRDRYAAAHPLCEMCLKEGRLTPVDEVHHIVPISQGGTHARDNLMSLCRSCHTKIHHDLGDR